MSAQDLLGQNLPDLVTGDPSGEIITPADMVEVEQAMLAVEMRTPPDFCNFQPLLRKNPPALCADVTGSATTVFSEDFESGLGDWTLTNLGVFSGWPDLDWVQNTDLPGDREGAAAFGATPDEGSCDEGDGDVSGVMRMESEEIVIPSATTISPRLTFEHYVATELVADGGNLKISINGGPYRLVPTSAYTFNPYNLVLGSTNPLATQAGFSGTDGGVVLGSWGQSQVNLAAAGVGVRPGDTVRFRYDMGMDGCTGIDGWYVDDVHAYTCSVQPPVCTNAVASPTCLKNANHKFVPISVVGVTDPNGYSDLDHDRQHFPG